MYLFRFLCLFYLGFAVNFYFAQTYVFAELSGSPSLNTSGWNLNGNAFVGDTPGDSDGFSNELILTNASNSQSGGVFYATPIDPSICSNWTVDFDYRIWGGSAADGISFCFLDVPPTGFVSGGGVGIPGSANGLKVVLDTWNNCGGPNPELQIYSGIGYDECAPGIVKLDNSGGGLGFVRNTNYQSVRITYDSGLITVFLNGVQYLSANFPIGFIGYMGFTASTGGANDQHSVRNVVIYTDQASSEAGANVAICSGDSVQIGSISNLDFVYDWSPTLGLDASDTSAPILTLSNTTSSMMTQWYTVSTSLSSNPGVCPSEDSVLVTVYPSHETILDIEICQNETYSFAGQNISEHGVYVDSVFSQFGCDSLVYLNLTVHPLYFDTLEVFICEGDNYVLGTQVLSSEGLFTEVFQSVDGCDSLVSINLIIHPLPELYCPDTLICIGDTAELIPYGAINYNWYPIIGNVETNGTLFTSPSLNTTFELSGIDANSCSSSIIVQLNIQPLPDINLTSSSEEICLNDSVFLMVSGGDHYIWISPDFSDMNAENQILLPNNTVDVKVIGFDELGCENNDSTTIIVLDLPTLDVSPIQSVCLGESVTVTVSGAEYYIWTPLGSGEEFQFSPSETIDLWITGTGFNGCSDSIYTSIIVSPNPEAVLSVDPLVSTSDSPHFTFVSSLQDGENMVLSTGDGVFYDYLNQSIEHSYPYTENDYLVQLYVENEYGCSDSVQIVIQIKGDEIYYVPNAFTPDGDEHNNTFYPVFTSGFDPMQFEMVIYNRWGQELIRYLDPNEYWDGTYNGSMCAEGVYVWKITYVVPESNESKTISGYINLLR